MESLRASTKLNLPSLQSKMKCDPEGYQPTLIVVHNQFNSLMEIFEENYGIGIVSTGINADPTFSTSLADRAMFLAHVTPFYPNHLANFPSKLIHLLRTKAPNLPSKLRCSLTRSLVLLVNHKIIKVGETLSLFMKLQTLGDKTLKKLAFDHVVHSIKRMSQESKNDVENRAVQNELFGMLQTDEKLAKRVLVTLCELHRRKVWFDERTANAICTACFHSSSSIMIAALSFLLGYEKIEIKDDSDNSSSDDEIMASPQVILSNAEVYKAKYQGTTASRKKKRAKLHRVIRSMKKQQRLRSERDNSYSPLNHLKDAKSQQHFGSGCFAGFWHEALKRLERCSERFEVRMMMMKLIARTVGLHRLILLEFYPFLKKYIQPHQRHVIDLLAMVVQACHDKVPLNAVEPLFKSIVNQFVHDRSQPEAITVGLNAVREICMRMPLLMNEDLLQDLVLYKKSHNKAISVAARSLIALFREVCPSLLAKKDRGRPIDPKARPKAYGKVSVATAAPGAELLTIIDNDHEMGNDDSNNSDNEQENDQISIDSYDDENRVCFDDTRGVDDDPEDNVIPEDGYETDYVCGVDDDVEDMESDFEDSEDLQKDMDDEISACEEDNDLHISSDDHDGSVEASHTLKRTAMKRKFAEYSGQSVAANSSLRALKKLAGSTMGHELPEFKDGFSNVGIQCVKELKEKQKNALAQHGLAKSAATKDPSDGQLCLKRVDRTALEAHVRKNLSKDKRLALVRAGREERGKYQARAAVKQRKMGGLSNRQKERKKKMPLAAMRDKIERHRIEKKKKHHRSDQQFRGRKAWKC